MDFLFDFFEDTKVIRRFFLVLLFIILQLFITFYIVNYIDNISGYTFTNLDIFLVGISTFISALECVNLVFLSLNIDVFDNILDFIIALVIFGIIFIFLQNFFDNVGRYLIVLNIGEFFYYTTGIALASLCIGTIIETIIFSIVALICKFIKKYPDEIKLEMFLENISTKTERITNKFEYVSKIISVLIIIITIITFIASIYFYFKDSKLDKTPENVSILSDDNFTPTALDIYFNKPLQIGIGILAILSYISACISYKTDGMINNIKLLLISVATYYIFVSILLWVVTNLLSIVRAIIFIVLFATILPIIVSISGGVILEQMREKSNLIDFVRDMKKK